jgi:4-oxalomesaconate tautomerase
MGMRADGGVPCMIMRGGSSKGAYFLADDLPADAAERDELLLRIMGTPDDRQIDGIGGAHPLTSKVAVVAPASDSRADIEYLFLQLGVGDRRVSDRQNCGNLLAGVGPFALERGLISATGESATTRIHMLNTDLLAVSTFEVADGRPVYSGDTSISGVPGTASPVSLEFEDDAEVDAGTLFPSGAPVDRIEGVDCTLVDNGMPVAVMAAADLGVSGYETCAELDSNVELLARLEAIRLEAGRLMGFGDVAETTVPKLTLVSPPSQGGNLNTRTFIPHRCHDAIGVFGAISVATAAIVSGSPAANVAEGIENGSIVLEHPSGTFEALMEWAPTEGTLPVIKRVGILRTARKLMDGVVYPREYE